MKQADLQFYQKTMPVLTQADWQATEAPAFGNVWWWLDCPLIEDEGIRANMQIGIVLYPQRSQMFVRLTTIDHPSKTFIQDLTAQTETTTLTCLLTEAIPVALNLIKTNMNEIKQSQQDWIDEVSRARLSS